MTTEVTDCHYGLKVCVPPNVYVEIWSDVMVLGIVAFGLCTHEWN